MISNPFGKKPEPPKKPWGNENPYRIFGVNEEAPYEVVLPFASAIILPAASYQNVNYQHSSKVVICAHATMQNVNRKWLKVVNN